MAYVPNNEREDVAAFIRELAYKGFEFDWHNIAHAISTKVSDDDTCCWNRLADLIEPNHTIGMYDVYTWAANCISDCGDIDVEPYNTILKTIEKYYKDTAINSMAKAVEKEA